MHAAAELARTRVRADVPEDIAHLALAKLPPHRPQLAAPQE
jgi:hypothetical protein